jgi:predicted nucleic acid-binding protein
VARPEVFDTSTLIDVFDHAERWRSFERSLRSGRVWLSSVVLAELYAGTRSPSDAFALDRIAGAMARVERLIVPSVDDWARAGRMIARRIRVDGALRPRDHLADVLILMSAARIGGVVLTANLRHFEAWERLAHSAGLDVTVQPADQAER